MSVETLEQKIAKQEERLRQLKAQKQAIAAREKKKNLIDKEKMILDVKFYWGLGLNKLKDEE
jgi:membrane protein involved in colicin uptake